MPATKWRPKGPIAAGPDNPRHEVWIEDEAGIRRMTSPEPGAETITVGGRDYTHTKEVGSGQWVYTLVEGQ